MDKAEVSMPSEEPTWDPSKVPFPGLRAFTPEEALMFSMAEAGKPMN